MFTDKLKQIMALFSGFVDSEKTSPMLRYKSPEEVAGAVDLGLRQQGLCEEEVMALLAQVGDYTTKTSGNRFYNQLFGGRIDVATVADMLVSLMNTSMYTYKAAGIHILIEQEVIDRMCQLVGFAGGEGIFTPGGSISNMMAMIMARNEACPDLKEQGFSGPRLIAYTSCQSHYSITKNAGLIGIGRANVRHISVDDAGHMLVEELRQTIEADLALGHQPFFINATTGTTVLGAFDPVAEIANVAEEFKLWLHVDGAWGGSLILNDKFKSRFEAVQRADSFTWDAHKMMGVPLSSSTILVKKKGLLEKHFSEEANYLFQVDHPELNPGMRSIQCGRRNDSLKVWAAWKLLGDTGYAKRIDLQRSLALYMAEQVERDSDFTLFIQPESLNVCFSFNGICSEAICDQLNRDGLLKVGYGSFNEHSFIRAICVNPDLSFSDIDLFLTEIKAVARQLGNECNVKMTHSSKNH